MTQQAQNKSKQTFKKYLVFAVMILVFLGCMWLIFAPSEKDKEAGQEGIGFNADIPDPRGDGIVGDKKTAYEQEQLRQKQEEKMRSLQDYSYLLGDKEETPEERAAREERQIRMAPKPIEYQEYLNAQEDGRGGGYGWSNRSTSGAAYADLTGTLGNFYEEPETDPEKEELESEVERLKAALAEQENKSSGYDEQLALIEKSFELAARYNTPAEPAEPAVQEGAVGRSTRVVPVAQVSTSVVSSLDRPVSDAEFVQMFSQERNFGFNTVSAAEQAVEKNTIAAVVHGEQVLVDGQSVRLRTTEPMRAGRILIPRNTIITGIGKISGERLEIAVTSIEYDGNIIPVEMTAYDSDGQQGIYIPGSMEMTAVKEIAGNMGQSLGTTINLNQQSAGEQLLTDLGRGVIQGTSQYISKKVRQVKVTLKSGYRLYLLPGAQV